jgi:hypothetical protein
VRAHRCVKKNGPSPWSSSLERASYPMVAALYQCSMYPQDIKTLTLISTWVLDCSSHFSSGSKPASCKTSFLGPETHWDERCLYCFHTNMIMQEQESHTDRLSAAQGMLPIPNGNVYNLSAPRCDASSGVSKKILQTLQLVS